MPLPDDEEAELAALEAMAEAQHKSRFTANTPGVTIVVPGAAPRERPASNPTPQRFVQNGYPGGPDRDEDDDG
jgi:hypothetical protein